MHTDPRRRTLLLSAAATAGLTLLPARAPLAQEAEPSRLDVPYVPTPQEVVDRMLSMGKVGKNDVLYDLGCGDGRIVVTAARVHGRAAPASTSIPCASPKRRKTRKRPG